jgi:hypothetical protein
LVRKVTNPIRLKDGTVLLSLSDARDCLLRYFTGVTQNDALVHAVVLLMKAAGTGTRQDRRAATEQVNILLSVRELR